MKNRVFISATKACAVVLFIVVFARVLYLQQHNFRISLEWSLANSQRIQKEWGFKLESPVVNGKDVLLLKKVTHSSPLRLAGMSDGDEILGESDVSFFQKVDTSRARVVEVLIFCQKTQSKKMVKLGSGQ